MKKTIIGFILLSILFLGCDKNNVEVGKVYQNQSLSTDELSEMFKDSKENLYIFSAEIQNNLFNSLEITINYYKNNELIDSEKKEFDLKQHSNDFNIFLNFNSNVSTANICINSDKLYTYSKLLDLSELKNKLFFEPSTESNIIYSSDDGNYSNEILLGSLKEVDGHRKYDISFKLEYDPSHIS